MTIFNLLLKDRVGELEFCCAGFKGEGLLGAELGGLKTTLPLRLDEALSILWRVGEDLDPMEDMDGMGA